MPRMMPVFLVYPSRAGNAAEQSTGTRTCVSRGFDELLSN
jgi:hypothetical protein